MSLLSGLVKCTHFGIDSCILLLISNLFWIYDWSSQLHTQLKQLKKLKPEKQSGLNGIRTHDLCMHRYRLSYSVSRHWELVTLWVRNISIECELTSSNIWSFIYSFASFTFYRYDQSLIHIFLRSSNYMIFHIFIYIVGSSVSTKVSHHRSDFDHILQRMYSKVTYLNMFTIMASGWQSYSSECDWTF